MLSSDNYLCAIELVWVCKVSMGGVFALMLAGCGGGEQDAVSDLSRGVTDDTIVIGSHTDPLCCEVGMDLQ